MQSVELNSREMLVQYVRELWCGGCGYGVIVRREPPACPMCQKENWRARPRPAQYN